MIERLRSGGFGPWANAGGERTVGQQPSRLAKGVLGDGQAPLSGIFTKVMAGIGKDTSKTFDDTPERTAASTLRFVDAAERDGFTREECLQYINDLKYAHRVKSGQPVHVEVINDFIIASCGDLELNDIFTCGGEEVRDGVRMNGIFGSQRQIPVLAELAHVDDLMPFLYAINHAQYARLPFPAYFIFLSETPDTLKGKEVDGKGVRVLKDSGAWYKAEIALARRELFIGYVKGKTATEIVGENILVADRETEPSEAQMVHKIPMPAVLYERKTRTFWLVQRGEGSNIFATSFESWLATEKESADRPEIFEKHAKRLALHREYGVCYSKLGAPPRKTVACVDGRHNGNIKEFGSLLTPGEFESLVSNPETLAVHVGFHTHCGYIKGAVIIHDRIQELAGKLETADAETGERVAALFKKLLDNHGPVVHKTNFSELFGAKLGFERDGTAWEFFYTLFVRNDESPRNSIRHMVEHGVMDMDGERGLVVVPACVYVDEALDKMGSGTEIGKDHRRILILEELARLDMERKTAWLGENAENIRQARGDGTLPAVEWFIEDFRSRRDYRIPEKKVLTQTVLELADPMREDVRLGILFNVLTGKPVNDKPT